MNFISFGTFNRKIYSADALLIEFDSEAQRKRENKKIATRTKTVDEPDFNIKV